MAARGSQNGRAPDVQAFNELLRDDHDMSSQFAHLLVPGPVLFAYHRWESESTPIGIEGLALPSRSRGKQINYLKKEKSDPFAIVFTRVAVSSAAPEDKSRLFPLLLVIADQNSLTRICRAPYQHACSWPLGGEATWFFWRWGISIVLHVGLRESWHLPTRVGISKRVKHCKQKMKSIPVVAAFTWLTGQVPNLQTMGSFWVGLPGACNIALSPDKSELSM
ncbi:hypothetical protein BDK51DRAFT_47606 [Blyttiomyces helicus]|uniref:Uncharacterized protein n=1 Tax=Blyttiomyces helicus TaxID=388810 RepID=A0A4P9W442_9FUNG|nr:hypothetical protein BDK51DRAFT_47606 [Blyttiomyces helicus]|eukprot:RKO87111.1 hypothetical protein BDK51DRAFT_47606 [Blyttiomyces helicus]